MVAIAVRIASHNVVRNLQREGPAQNDKPEVVGMAEDDQTESDKIDTRSVKHVSSTGKLKLARLKKSQKPT